MSCPICVGVSVWVQLRNIYSTTNARYKNYSIFYQLSCNSMLATGIDFTQNLNHRSTTHL